jgi:hypothetical protein
LGIGGLANAMIGRGPVFKLTHEPMIHRLFAILALE